jgi:hypothetical protein
MPQNLLKNGGFEADWGDERSHRCLIFPEGAAPYTTDIENILTPPGWVVWFHHKPGTWDQPEVRDAWQQSDPHRVHSGRKGILLFTFYRGHDAGFLQQVRVTPGTRLRLTAWAHAWSNHKVPGYAHYGNARCSVGVGCGPVYILEGQAPPLNRDPLNDAIGNFTFGVGIDPTGGTNPFASTVVWGKGAHIYNEYHQVPAVEATAQGDTLTVFLRSKTLWAFENSDAYWDDAELTVVEPDVPVNPLRGLPRTQYERVYVLLPPDANAAWVTAVLDATWNRSRYTVGGGADDAGIGDLDNRRVIAVNPTKWPNDLRAFFERYYPGVKYTFVEAATPAELARKLKQL